MQTAKASRKQSSLSGKESAQVEGVPGLPGAPQEEAGLTRKFETSHVGAAFSSYDGDLSLPLGLALGSPIFPSGCVAQLCLTLQPPGL